MNVVYPEGSQLIQDLNRIVRAIEENYIMYKKRYSDITKQAAYVNSVTVLNMDTDFHT